MTTRSRSRGFIDWCQSLAASSSLTWAAALATQFVAARLGRHRYLGSWLFRTLPGANVWLGAGVVVCTAMAVGMLLSVRSRWAAVPVVFLAVSAVAMRNGPVYAPIRVFVWYSAYGNTRAFARLFQAAWVILVGASLLLVVASGRLLRSAVPTNTSSDARGGAKAEGNRRDGSPPGSLIRNSRQKSARSRRGHSRLTPL
jgi:hypothetical protein